MRLSLPIFFLALVALATAACRSENAGKSSAAGPPPVVVTQPQRRDAVRSITLPGDLVGYYEAALHAKVTGYLNRISVDKGDWVKEGQVLAELEVPELQQNLVRANADLELQRLTYERMRRVRQTDPRLVAEQDVDIAQSKWAQAKAQVEVLQTMVGYTKIIAPFDGVITGRFADPGALIRAGGGNFTTSGVGAEISPSATEGAGGHEIAGPVLTLARIDRLRVYVYVPESEAGLVRRGCPVRIAVRAFPGRVVTGTVTRYASALDLSTRTMLVEADIENPGNLLYPRMYAYVTLELERHPHALEIPSSAVSLRPDASPYVFLVRDGELVRAPVTVGINDGTYIEITGGLSSKDQVVSYLSPSLLAGVKVKAVPASMATTELVKD